jgi:hypothetical protein
MANFKKCYRNMLKVYKNEVNQYMYYYGILTIKTSAKKVVKGAEKKVDAIFHVNKLLRNTTPFEYRLLIMMVTTGE